MFFVDCTTPEKIKARYRKLAMEWHPDLNAHRVKEANAKMKAINVAYHDALKNVSGYTSTGTDGRERTYKYDPEIEQAAIEIINQLLALKMPAVDIYMIGCWVWVTGETKPHRKELGKHGLGLKFNGQRKCWYWKPPQWGRSFSRKDASLADLGRLYGARKFAAQQEENDGKKRRQKRLRA